MINQLPAPGEKQVKEAIALLDKYGPMSPSADPGEMLVHLLNQVASIGRARRLLQALTAEPELYQQLQSRMHHAVSLTPRGAREHVEEALNRFQRADEVLSKFEFYISDAGSKSSVSLLDDETRAHLKSVDELILTFWAIRRWDSLEDCAQRAIQCLRMQQCAFNAPSVQKMRREAASWGRLQYGPTSLQLFWQVLLKMAQ